MTTSHLQETVLETSPGSDVENILFLSHMCPHHTCTHTCAHTHSTPLYTYFYKKKSSWLSKMIKVILDEYKNAEVIEVLNTGIKVLPILSFGKKKPP